VTQTERKRETEREREREREHCCREEKGKKDHSLKKSAA